MVDSCYSAGLPYMTSTEPISTHCYAVDEAQLKPQIQGNYQEPGRSQYTAGRPHVAWWVTSSLGPLHNLTLLAHFLHVPEAEQQNCTQHVQHISHFVSINFLWSPFHCTLLV